MGVLLLLPAAHLEEGPVEGAPLLVQHVVVLELGLAPHPLIRLQLGPERQPADLPAHHHPQSRIIHPPTVRQAGLAFMTQTPGGSAHAITLGR